MSVGERRGVIGGPLTLELRRWRLPIPVLFVDVLQVPKDDDRELKSGHKELGVGGATVGSNVGDSEMPSSTES